MSIEEFEKIVEEGIQSIPPQFLEKMNNVEIVIEENPSPEELKELKIKKNDWLFGLYQGIPKTERLGDYSQVLPDKITIFKNPIEKAARLKEDIKEIVKDTVWHEIAHHFGLNEREVREAEKRRSKK
ncbi:MAG: metallopeptidase family protein [Candidatus Paceibacterota bacterium]|jgi:predicted Zn-dependent protease with MMP-like domain|nr:metallopeptidase family protein [Candidatus Paceibacterota bacterium]MDD4830577.1 metallopeptidase family protein [Candidatus Paceibacterota bacterium]MDD4874952.1 metallopeptidase family protein [Candidatus Paceibacterota bacterium]